MVKMTATKIISYIKRKLYQTQIFLRWFKELSKLTKYTMAAIFRKTFFYCFFFFFQQEFHGVISDDCSYWIGTSNTDIKKNTKNNCI